MTKPKHGGKRFLSGPSPRVEAKDLRCERIQIRVTKQAKKNYLKLDIEAKKSFVIQLNEELEELV